MGYTHGEATKNPACRRVVPRDESWDRTARSLWRRSGSGALYRAAGGDEPPIRDRGARLCFDVEPLSSDREGAGREFEQGLAVAECVRRRLGQAAAKSVGGRSG